MKKPHLTAGLINHIEGEIMPRYEAFDKAHDRRHAFAVMSQSLRLAQCYDVNTEMVYTIAAYHDLGLEKGREQHHTESARIVRKDERLKKFFTADQIGIIADAVEDHRASNSHEPRTIYGKIVAEADRIIESHTIMQRTIQYGLANYPALSEAEHIERAIAHIKEKYGRGGYLKLWIPESSNAKRLAEFCKLIDNEKKLREELTEIYKTEKDKECIY
jgi:uncharacterized protein